MPDPIQKWLERTQKYPVVAFDVFDTLIFRDVAAPDDLFGWMEASGRAPQGFAQKRTAAEHTARLAAPHGEITLKDVYGQAELYGLPDLPGLMSAECAAELRAATPNPVLLALCRALRAAGKQLYILSDMYLPAVQIAAMLDKCGYPAFDGVYVSSEYGVQKRSGKLFARFLEQERLTAGEVVFIGDNPRADGLGACFAGIHALLLPKRKPLLQYTPLAGTAMADTARRAFTENLLVGAPPLQSLGIETTGPLLTGFAAWLHARCQAQNGGAGRLVFLARDMYMTRQTYACLYPDEATGYLKVSRRSLCPALLLAAARDPVMIEGLLLDALPREVLSVRQLVGFCGMNPELPELQALLPADLTQAFDLRERPAAPKVIRLLGALAQAAGGPLGGEVQRQAVLTRQYLEASGVWAPGALLVDIGSGGTIQRAIEAIGGRGLQGCYLACDARLHSHLPASRAAVYLFEGQPAPLWFWMGQPLLEYLISEPCGATIGYCLGADGLPHPCVADGVPMPAIGQIQAGAQRYGARWHETLCWPEPTPAQAIAPFLALTRAPRLADAVLLGDFVLEDGVEYPLAAPAALGHYLCHPAEFKRDLMASHWKIAFLKRLLRLPAPYDTLYAFLKKR